MGYQLLYDAAICPRLFLLLPFTWIQADGALLRSSSVCVLAWQMLQRAKRVSRRLN